MSFLALEQVLQIHDKVIDICGGERGVKDISLLISAIEAPKATLHGELLHPTVFDQAAAYLYHIVFAQPFIAGNNAVALAASLIFLQIMDKHPQLEDHIIEDMILKVSQGVCDKQEISDYFKLRSL